MEYFEKIFRSKKSSVPEEYYKDLFSVDDHFHELPKDSVESSHEFYLFLEEDKILEGPSFRSIYYVSHKMPSSPAKNSLVFQFLRTIKEMKYYYEARANIMHRFSQRNILLFLDGKIREPVSFFTKMEAMCFCYFIMIQREKYNLLMDVEFIQNLSNNQINKLLFYYDFLETLKWSIYDPMELKKIKGLVYFLTRQKKVMKDYFKLHPNIFMDVFDDSLSYFQDPPIEELSNIANVILLRSTKYNKTIYLFGEHHSFNHPCHKENAKNTYIAPFIKKILRTPSFFKDFIFERWYNPSSYTGTSDIYMNESDDYILDKMEQTNIEEPEIFNHNTQSSGNFSFFEKDECLERNAAHELDKKAHLHKKVCKSYRIENGDPRRNIEYFLNTNYGFFIRFNYHYFYGKKLDSEYSFDSPFEIFSKESLSYETYFNFLSSPI
jgi:hypothetical protein